MLKRNDTAQFDLLTYFEGTTTGIGYFEDRGGRLKRRFTVDLTGRAAGSILHLEEQFEFEDGERQRRSWRLARGAGARFSGTSEDCVGEAEGRFEPGLATLESRLRLPVGRRLVSMRFEDVYHDAGGGMVLNRSMVSKWGIRLGQVLILFRKPPQRSP